MLENRPEQTTNPQPAEAPRPVELTDWQKVVSFYYKYLQSNTPYSLETFVKKAKTTLCKPEAIINNLDIIHNAEMAGWTLHPTGCFTR